MFEGRQKENSCWTVFLCLPSPSLRRLPLRCVSRTRVRCTRRPRGRSRCGISSAGFRRLRRCRCETCCPELCEKSRHLSDLGSGWVDTLSCCMRRTETTVKSLFQNGTCGSCPGERKDGSFFSDWGSLSG